MAGGLSTTAQIALSLLGWCSGVAGSMLLCPGCQVPSGNGDVGGGGRLVACSMGYLADAHATGMALPCAQVQWVLD